MLKAAKSWGLTPEEFRARPYTEQLEMMAEVTATNWTERYEAYVAEKRMKAKQARGAKNG